MSLPGPYCYAEAFIADDGQIDWMGDGVLYQLVTVMLVDDAMEVEPAVGALTAQQARDLAVQLLAAAEHAERRVRQQLRKLALRSSPCSNLCIHRAPALPAFDKRPRALPA